MNIERKIKLKNMENNSEPLSPDNVNEESILKSVQKNNDSEESLIIQIAQIKMIY